MGIVAWINKQAKAKEHDKDIDLSLAQYETYRTVILSAQNPQGVQTLFEHFGQELLRNGITFENESVNFFNSST